MTEAVIVAMVSAIASIITVALQIRGANQNKVDNKAQKKIAQENASDIKDLLEDTIEKVNTIVDSQKANDAVSVATARSVIKRFHAQLAEERVITVSDKAMIMELYNAYKQITYPDGHHPNSWCDAAIKDMESWEVVPDNYVYKVYRTKK